MTIYHGTCHCGAVAFEADLDLSQPTSRCNCSYCSKTRNWSTRTMPDHFRLVRGEDQLGLYDVTGQGYNAHAFCRNCGVRLFSKGDIPELGGAYVSIFLPALDDVPPEDLIAAPLVWCDGLNNNWWQPPAETRHL